LKCVRDRHSRGRKAQFTSLINRGERVAGEPYLKCKKQQREKLGIGGGSEKRWGNRKREGVKNTNPQSPERTGVRMGGGKNSKSITWGGSTGGGVGREGGG